MMEVLKDHWGQKEVFKHQLSQDKSKFELWVDCFRSMTFSGSWKSFFGAQVCASLIGSWLNCIFTFLLLFFRMLLRWKLIRPMRVSLSRWRNSERRTAEKTEASLAEELIRAAAPGLFYLNVDLLGPQTSTFPFIASSKHQRWSSSRREGFVFEMLRFLKCSHSKSRTKTIPLKKHQFLRITACFSAATCLFTGRREKHHSSSSTRVALAEPAFRWTKDHQMSVLRHQLERLVKTCLPSLGCHVFQNNSPAVLCLF